MLTTVCDRPLQASEVKIHNCLLGPVHDDLFMAQTGGRMSHGEAAVIKGLVSAFRCYSPLPRFLFKLASFQTVYTLN